MRIQDIKSIIQNNIHNLYLRAANVGSNNSQVEGMLRIKTAILNLKDLPGIKETVAEIISLNIVLESFTDAIHINTPLATVLVNLVARLNSECTILDRLLTNLVPEKSVFAFSLKLQPMQDFSEFNNTISDIEKIILRPIGIIGESVKIGDLEYGSRWLDIVFTSSIAFYCFAGLVEKSFDLFIDKYQKSKALEIVLKNFTHSTETIENLKKSAEDDFKRNCEIKTIELITEFQNSEFLAEKKDQLNELCTKNKNEIQFAIEKQAELIEKGLEIYKAIEDADQQHRSIPNFKDKEQIINDQKLLSKE